MADEEASLLAAPGRGPRRGRILVLDGDLMLRETIRRQLAVFGYETEALPEGRKAVAAYVHAREIGRPFDGVILDLEVDGGWGGERTLVELRALDPGVRAMVCSGTLVGSGETYLRQGFNSVLAKPYGLGELRRKLELMLA